MFYVYRLRSIGSPDKFYTGYTTDVAKRLQSHNSGQVPHTSKYKPWKILNYFAFEDKGKSLDFEKYLKTGSGRAFAKKHFE